MHQLSPCAFESVDQYFYSEDTNFEFQKVYEPPLEAVDLDSIPDITELDPTEVSFDLNALISGTLFADQDHLRNIPAPGHFSAVPSSLSNSSTKYMHTPTGGFGLKAETSSDLSGWIKQESTLPGCQLSSSATSPTEDWVSSNCSSPAPSSIGDDLPTTIEETTSGRGRRSLKASPPGSKLLRIGRKVLSKDSDEYRSRRERNNVAVRKSRDKAKHRQRETETRVRGLADENDRLQKKLDLLSKELSVLKSLFINVGATIPPEYRKLFDK